MLQRVFQALSYALIACGVLSFALTVNVAHAQTPAAAEPAPAHPPPRAEPDATEPPGAAVTPVPTGDAAQASLAPVTPADESEQLIADEPTDLRPASRPVGFLIGGVATFAASYLLTALYAGLVTAVNSSDCEYQWLDSCSETRRLFIPIVGPWLATDHYGTLAVVFGISQAIGVLMTIWGAVDYASGRTMHARAAAPQSPLLLTAAPVRGGLVFSSQMRF